MAEVTLNRILSARDERVKKQQNILKRFNHPIVSFTMNIAGPAKTSPLIERSFSEGIRLLEERLQSHILYRDAEIKDTGCEAIFSVNCSASRLKDICTHIEESSALGRLFDMDVIDTDHSKPERKNPRGCLVCNAPGRNCAVSRAHSVETLQNATKEIMENYFFELDKECCCTLAVKSLLDEVYTTPKPGLVDCRNNGSHGDMNVNLFEKSANALKPYFGECFAIGKNTRDMDFDEAFSLLRKCGISAEKTMFNATGGVNTHKGAIYSLGILCASIGRLWSAENPFATPEHICRESAKLAKNSIQADFDRISTSSPGGKVYLKYGLYGIRGEVASGFESVIKIGLPCYNNLKSKNLSANDAGAVTLLHLIAKVKDTNLYYRGKEAGARYAAESSANLLKTSPLPDKEQIQLLDDEFIKRNLSPGGCADLLAITYFLYNFQQ